MEGIRILLLAGAIGATMAGGLYAGVRADRAPGAASEVAEAGEAGARVSNDTPVLSAPTPVEAADPHPADEPPTSLPTEADGQPEATPSDNVTDSEEPAGIEPVITLDLDGDDDDAELYATGDIVLEGGLRIGPMKVFDPEDESVDAADSEPTAASRPRPSRRARARRPRRPPLPRLHPNPGMHTILTARRMMASGEVIQGSCYRYLSEVYERAGHRSWRKRRIVYRAERDGPYADLSLVRPGDWLYIVNDPGRTPVGTHSVMFVRWEDRGRGYASVISHPGWGAPSAGRERTYDVSQTYRIIRPTL